MKSPLADKSYRFAVQIVSLHKVLSKSSLDITLCRQLLKSGTSIGANVSEGNDTQSEADFLNKMGIALKEAKETLYWINLLSDTSYLTAEQKNDLKPKCEELIKMLASTVKTMRKKLGR
jgi:four helix bundle protein